MASRDERIASLAATLKGSGVAKSDSQARMMAEEMIGVEEHVQKRFDEEHTKAQEFLMTSKNLGTAGTIRQHPEKAKLEPLYTEKSSQHTAKIEPVKAEQKQVTPEYSPVDTAIHEKHVKLEEAPIKHEFGNKSLKDLMMGQIEEDHHEVKNIEELKEEITMPKEESVREEPLVQQSHEADNSHEVEVQIDETAERVYGDDITQDKPIEKQMEENPGLLDTNKLVEMMEEDGKMEEHTREIKEKPKNVKPKEEYAENNIDLSAMFNVHK